MRKQKNKQTRGNKDEEEKKINPGWSGGGLPNCMGTKTRWVQWWVTRLSFYTIFLTLHGSAKNHETWFSMFFSSF
jgi:hypothetical protein